MVQEELAVLEVVGMVVPVVEAHHKLLLQREPQILAVGVVAQPLAIFLVLLV